MQPPPLSKYRIHSIHPFIQPKLSLPHTRPPLTYAINTFLIIQYSSILSTCPNHLILFDLLYSLTPILLQLSYAPLYSYLYPFMTLQPNFSNTSSQEHSLPFSQHFSYPTLYNAIGTIIHSCRQFFAFIPNPLLLSTLFSTPHALYHSFILCTTSLYQLPLATPGT